MIEQSKLWRRPHPKPLEETITKSSKREKLEKNVIPALDIQDLVTHYWTWGEINHGDCTMSNATLWLNSDGTARFYAYTKTNDSGDVWLFRALSLLDNNGVSLYNIPQFNSPRMEWEDSWYTTDINLVFPNFMFWNIVSVNMTHHC
jgi:hypothetical protein